MLYLGVDSGGTKAAFVQADETDRDMTVRDPHTVMYSYFNSHS